MRQLSSRSSKMFNQHRLCQICQKDYRPVSIRQKYCSIFCQDKADKIRLAQKVPHTCSVCAREYLISRAAKKAKKAVSYCPECLTKHRSALAKANPIQGGNEGRHNKLYARKAPKVKINAPCATCIHGVMNQASDIGWMCRANAMMCRPLAEKRLYTARPSA